MPTAHGLYILKVGCILPGPTEGQRGNEEGGRERGRNKGGVHIPILHTFQMNYQVFREVTVVLVISVPQTPINNNLRSHIHVKMSRQGQELSKESVHHLTLSRGVADEW